MRSYRIEFTDRARHDLLDIEDFYTPLNPQAAEKLIARISGSINTLSLFPRLGLESDTAGIHFHISRGYRFYYQIDDRRETIHILTIFDTRRDPMSLKI